MLFIKEMSEGNVSMGSDFILVGFTDQYTFQILSFLFFSAVYIFTIVGNLGMILLIRIDSRLHTPMYFFLSHLSLIDMCYSSTIVPKTLVNFLAGRKTISFAGCTTQLFFFAACATTEGYLLAAMAYDRYVAVCKPLLYTVVMSQKVCEGLLAGAYVIGVMSSAIHTISIFRLPFCHSHKINHFFCDGPPLLTLACSDTHFNERLLFAVVGFNILITTAVILASYLSVLTTVLTIHSTEGRCKAFSTCASHLVTVTLFYGSSLFMYSRPSSSHSLDQDKVVSVLYSVTIPMLNPLIYSMRNKEVKDALRKLITGRNNSQIDLRK
ncbi:olfactory receptor 8D1-like [Ahaetulla prasina]|uniref:olfactory receptor 8D1-like n=1 Tax=Ahaetulla prasina TaxID=499056 RepID=UPI0026481A3A|nr:olfactory receptor 8D1-like [Ahaetulla prasina]